MSKTAIFISHIEEEAELAGILKKHLLANFPGMIDVFDSSDAESILAGENWLISIDKWLRAACVELVLCSEASINRPWVNFEAGAAWLRKITIIPVCHSRLHPKALPMPFSVFQGIEARQEAGLDRIFARVASQLKCDKPAVALGEIVEEVRAFEKKYVVQFTRANVFQEDRVIGLWEGTGTDLKVADYPPLELYCSYNLKLDLRREGSKIRGELLVDIIERQTSTRTMMELINVAGDNFTFSYRLAIPNANHFGVMMFQLQGTGEEMNGYFLANKAYEPRLATGVVKFRRQAL